jgi:hypothetical protein
MPIAELETRTADLKARTKQFALPVMKLVDALPRTIQGRTIANQIIRSAASVVEGEADETSFRLELIIDSALLNEARIRPLLIEAGELVAIMAASRKSAIGNRQSAIQ